MLWDRKPEIGNDQSNAYLREIAYALADETCDRWSLRQDLVR